VLGAATLADAVRNRREDLMAQMRDQLDRDAQAFGIQVVDVRIRRVDLPEQNSQAVYQRMQTERQREAAEFRAQGSQKSQEIRARADRDVTVLLAEATSQAENIRGQGDSERNRIFADAYGKDANFFLVDCREPDEYATAHIEGAMLLPMSELGERLHELSPHQTKQLVIHCHHGGRSMQVAMVLSQNGFASVANIAGGIDAWSVELDPSIARY